MQESVIENQREVKEWMEKLTQQVNYVEPKEKGETSRGAYQRRNATPDGVCFNCKRKGHFSRDCTHFFTEKRKRSGNDQQPDPRESWWSNRARRRR